MIKGFTWKMFKESCKVYILEIWLRFVLKQMNMLSNWGCIIKEYRSIIKIKKDLFIIISKSNYCNVVLSNIFINWSLYVPYPKNVKCIKKIFYKYVKKVHKILQVWISSKAETNLFIPSTLFYKCNYFYK